MNKLAKPRIWRGNSFEKMVEMQNDLYRKQGLGVVQKIPTPTTLSRDGRFFRELSTVDYLGVLGGVCVAFDAKETSGKSLPIRNIKPHQLTFMENAEYGGAITFFLVNFVGFDEIYLIKLSPVLDLIKACAKSIPIEIFRTTGFFVCASNKLPDYLSVLRPERRRYEAD